MEREGLFEKGEVGGGGGGCLFNLAKRIIGKETNRPELRLPTSCFGSGQWHLSDNIHFVQVICNIFVHLREPNKNFRHVNNP